jgi:hypothetical protein
MSVEGLTPFFATSRGGPVDPMHYRHGDGGSLVLQTGPGQYNEQVLCARALHSRKRSATCSCLLALLHCCAGVSFARLRSVSGGASRHQDTHVRDDVLAGSFSLALSRLCTAWCAPEAGKPMTLFVSGTRTPTASSRMHNGRGSPTRSHRTRHITPSSGRQKMRSGTTQRHAPVYMQS